MNVGQYIKNAKKKFNKVKENIDARKRMNTEKRVSKIKEKRIKEESMAKLYAEENREQRRLEKAKKFNEPHTTFGRISKNLSKGNVRSVVGSKDENKYKLGGGPSWGATGGGPNWSSLGPPTMREKGSYSTSNLWGLGKSKTRETHKKSSKWQRYKSMMRREGFTASEARDLYNDRPRRRRR